MRYLVGLKGNQWFLNEVTELQILEKFFVCTRFIVVHFVLCKGRILMLTLARRRLASAVPSLTPLSDRVLVLRIKPAEKTIGGSW
jgi:hypothetical protein